MLINIFQDYYTNRGNFRIQIILILFRIAHNVQYSKYRFFYYAGIPYLLFYRFITEFILSIELRPRTVIGPRLKIDHGYCLVINDRAVIGMDVRLRHCTTIGCKILEDGTQGPSPIIGNGVDIGACSVILGGIHIHQYSKIGAGSVVITDVPEASTFAGNPAKKVNR